MSSRVVIQKAVLRILLAADRLRNELRHTCLITDLYISC